MKGVLRLAAAMAAVIGIGTPPSPRVLTPLKNKRHHHAPDNYNDDPIYRNGIKPTTHFPPSARNGAQECARRIKQGKAGTCYIHGYQYLGIS